MKDIIALYSDLKDYEKDVKFLEDVLLISTDCDTKDIDEIFDFCIKETSAYAVSTHSIPAEAALKKNSIASMLYTLQYLRDYAKYSPLSQVVREYKSEKPLTEDYNKAYYLFDKTMEGGYLNSFALIKEKPGDKEKKRLVCNFCKEFTLHIIGSQQNKSKNTLIEEIRKFPLGSYVDYLKKIYHYVIQQNDSVFDLKNEDKDSLEQYLELVEQHKRFNEKCSNESFEETKIFRPTYTKNASMIYWNNRKSKEYIKKIFEGLYFVQNEWYSKGDLIEQFLYEYKKEMVFHSAALFSDEENSRISSDEFCNLLNLPLAYDINDICKEMPSVLCQDFVKFTMVTIPVLEKAFFATLFKIYNCDIERCIKTLSEYILVHYNSLSSKTPSQFKYDSVCDLEDEYLRKELSIGFINAYTARYKFGLFLGFNINQKKYSQIKTDKKLFLASDYCMHITNSLNDLYFYDDEEFGEVETVEKDGE